MGWTQWPFHPRSLTDMIGPGSATVENEGFISLLISGCSERLDRPLTIFEPELDKQGEIVKEPDSNDPAKMRWKLRRIEQINPLENFTPFCKFLANLPEQEKACLQSDEKLAHSVMVLASDNSESYCDDAEGCFCRMNLVGHVSLIKYHETPLAVVLSGQFLPEGNKSKERFDLNIVELGNNSTFTDEQRRELRNAASSLETRTTFIQRKYTIAKKRNAPLTYDLSEKPEKSVSQLFLEVVKDIERIGHAQFQMQKRTREIKFLSDLREKFPFLAITPVNSVPDGKKVFIEQTHLILNKIRGFCNTEYLALFISPKRYISYEENLNLCPPYVFVGVGDDIKSGISHFNWRKAGLMPGLHLDTEDNSDSLVSKTDVASLGILMDHTEIQKALKGLKGETKEHFDSAAILCHLHLSDAYRAILIWGPFSHLSPAELKEERHFLEEVAELVMMRTLTSVQRLDSEQRTRTWGDIATLLAHYSRRAMTPVSTGVRIISDHLQGSNTYSIEEALKACESLDTAARFISHSVRVPLVSFAAQAEKVYKFFPASLGTIVDSCITLFYPNAMDKGVTVVVYPDVYSLPQVEVDLPKITDTIGYVIDNAIKYSHKNKEIRIYSEVSGNRVRLTIEDFGQGINDDEKRLIFGRGYQGERSRKAKWEEGEGMGLFHARLIIEAHKGAIWCDCKSGPRESTSKKLEGFLVRFTIELPMKQDSN